MVTLFSYKVIYLMNCYNMFCVANLMKNMMTLFKIHHRNTLSSISVNLLQLRHVSNKI